MHTTLFNQKEQGQQGSLNGAEFLANNLCGWGSQRVKDRIRIRIRLTWVSLPTSSSVSQKGVVTPWLAVRGERLKLLSLIN